MPVRTDENYEIMRALDELPHIVGATCATALLRASHNKTPSRDEYRRRAAECFAEYTAQIAQNDGLSGLRDYIKRRINEETERILSGKNPQVERRYKRYVDYG